MQTGEPKEKKDTFTDRVKGSWLWLRELTEAETDRCRRLRCSSTRNRETTQDSRLSHQSIDRSIDRIYPDELIEFVIKRHRKSR